MVHSYRSVFKGRGYKGNTKYHDLNQEVITRAL